jgi:hypothetical protein
VLSGDFPLEDVSMNRIARFAKFVPLLALVVLLQGCAGGLLLGGAAVAGGAATYSYVRGTYRAVLNAPLYQSDRALRAVAKRAKLVERKRECTGYKASYVYTDLSDLKVHFKLRAVTPETTRIYIRVGTFGDKESSQALLHAIDQELQAAPAL